MYEDFQCPHCLEFEQSVGPTIDADVRGRTRRRCASTRWRSWTRRRTATATPPAPPTPRCAPRTSASTTFVKYHNVLYGKDTRAEQCSRPRAANGRTDGELRASTASRPGITGDRLDDLHHLRDQRGAQGAGRGDHGAGVARTASPARRPSRSTGNAELQHDLAALQAAIAAAERRRGRRRDAVTRPRRPSQVTPSARRLRRRRRPPTPDAVRRRPRPRG